MCQCGLAAGEKNAVEILQRISFICPAIHQQGIRCIWRLPENWKAFGVSLRLMWIRLCLPNKDMSTKVKTFLGICLVKNRTQMKDKCTCLVKRYCKTVSYSKSRFALQFILDSVSINCTGLWKNICPVPNFFYFWDNDKWNFLEDMGLTTICCEGEHSIPQEHHTSSETWWW